MNVSVIIPTYQEKANIKNLIDSLTNQLKKTAHKYTFVVCDDNSPDGTGEIVERLAKNNKNIVLVSGDKKGYGKAIVRGVSFVIKKTDSDVAVFMDADFSHDPKEVGKLIGEIESGADFVIGSRYVAGGKISANWSQFRRFNSRWGNRFARYLVGIRMINDCTSGFRAVRTIYLKKIDFKLINEKGYSFLVKVLYEAKNLGAKVVEVPITFSDRRAGETKLGFWDIIEFITMSLKVFFKRTVG